MVERLRHPVAEGDAPVVARGHAPRQLDVALPRASDTPPARVLEVDQPHALDLPGRPHVERHRLLDASAVDQRDVLHEQPQIGGRELLPARRAVSHAARERLRADPRREAQAHGYGLLRAAGLGAGARICRLAIALCASAVGPIALRASATHALAAPSLETLAGASL